ncbi:MAG TPA: SRPBCC family protein [Ktedonobacteraceae bacterium]
MLSLQFTVDINGPRETIFDLIADLAHYNRWLPGSRVFGGMTQVSSIPPGVGTIYDDGTMHGSITEFNPPERITFEQSMPVKALLLAGKLGFRVRYTLEATGSDGQSTHVIRDVTFNLQGILRAARPLIAGTIRRESGRLLEMMKRYVEGGNVN